MPTNPWIASVVVSFAKAMHHHHDTQALPFPDAPEGKLVDVPLETIMRAHVKVRGGSDELTAADVLQFGQEMAAWCEAHCAGPWRYMISDRYSDDHFMQFQNRDDARAFMDVYSGTLRQPTKREREGLVDRTALKEKGV